MTDDLRVGVTGYPGPAGLTGPELAEWLLREAVREGFDIINLHPRQFRSGDAEDYDLEAMRRVRGLADELGVEIEPYVEHTFQLVDGEGAVTPKKYQGAIEAAKILGGPVLRTAYGRLDVPTSRFSRDVRIDDHLDRMATTLRAAASVAESAEVVLPVENHCDFSGAELAKVVECVGSPSVRVAFDTGNSWSIFADVHDDLRALGEYTVTTHIKDLRIEREQDPDRMPFRAVGCVAGEGSMYMSEIIDALLSRGPLGRRLPLIIELAWLVYADGEDRDTRKRETLVNSVRNVREMTKATRP